MSAGQETSEQRCARCGRKTYTTVGTQLPEGWVCFTCAHGKPLERETSKPLLQRLRTWAEYTGSPCAAEAVAEIERLTRELEARDAIYLALNKRDLALYNDYERLRAALEKIDGVTPVLRREQIHELVRSVLRPADEPSSGHCLTCGDDSCSGYHAELRPEDKTSPERESPK